MRVLAINKKFCDAWSGESGAWCNLIPSNMLGMQDCTPYNARYREDSVSKLNIQTFWHTHNYPPRTSTRSLDTNNTLSSDCCDNDANIVMMFRTGSWKLDTYSFQPALSWGSFCPSVGCNHQRKASFASTKTFQLKVHLPSICTLDSIISWLIKKIKTIIWWRSPFIVSGETSVSLSWTSQYIILQIHDLSLFSWTGFLPLHFYRSWESRSVSPDLRFWLIWVVVVMTTVWRLSGYSLHILLMEGLAWWPCHHISLIWHCNPCRW